MEHDGIQTLSIDTELDEEKRRHHLTITHFNLFRAVYSITG
jgi:hypothetical protein